MDHPCYRCGAPVKEGSPFCKNCGAPQIRVGAPDVPMPAPSAVPPRAEPPDQQRTKPPHQHPAPEFQQPPFPRYAPVGAPQPTPIHWSRALPGLLLAGAVEIFSFLGLGVFAGGFLAVILYRRRQPGQLLTTGMGARLGAVAGGLGFFFISIGMSIGVLLFHTGAQIRDAIITQIEQTAARNPSPQAQQMLDYFRSPDGFATMLGLGLFVTLLFYLVISTFGGMLAASIGKNRH